MSKVSLGDLSKACFTPKPVAFQTVMGNKDVLDCRKVGLVKPRGRRPTEVRFQKKKRWARKKDVGPRFKLNSANWKDYSMWRNTKPGLEQLLITPRELLHMAASLFQSECSVRKRPNLEAVSNLLCEYPQHVQSSPWQRVLLPGPVGLTSSGYNKEQTAPIQPPRI